MSTYDQNDGGHLYATDNKVISHIVSLVATCVNTPLMDRKKGFSEEWSVELYNISCDAVLDIITAFPTTKRLVDKLFSAADDNVKWWGGEGLAEDAADNIIDLQVIIDELTSWLPLSSYAKEGDSK